MVKAQKELAADINFPHIAVTQGGAAHIEDHPPLIYHFDAKSEKSQKIHANAAQTACAGRTLHATRPRHEGCRCRQRRHPLRDRTLFMTPDEEPLFLQVKEALCPVLEDRPAARGLSPARQPRGRRTAQHAGRKRCLCLAIFRNFTETFSRLGQLYQFGPGGSGGRVAS
jgi:hypothetical protein